MSHPSTLSASTNNMEASRWAHYKARFRAGSLAAMVALVCASLVAAALHVPSPLEPVAVLVMDRTPVPIAIPLLLSLGTAARPLALLGAIAIGLIVGGALAVVYPHHARRGARGAPRSGIRETSPQLRDEDESRSSGTRYAACPQNQAGRLPALPTRLTLFAVALTALAWFALAHGDARIAVVLIASYVMALWALFWKPQPVQPARRAFLLHTASILCGSAVLVGLLAVDPFARLLRAGGAGRVLFPWTPPGPRKRGFDIAGLAPEVTPPGHFYIMDEDLLQPDLALDTWALDVEGLVRRPVRLTFADLLALPRRDQVVTQECISNPVGGPLMSTALFSGVPVAAVLARTGIDRRATALLFRAPDGHEEAIPLNLALDGRLLLAYAQDGRLLERAHGFPLRALIPGLYGFKSVKWVTTLRLTTDPQAGWWEHEGWSPLPTVQTMARIDVAGRSGDGMLVAGVAFAGRRGVAAVQVRANGGPWHTAEIHTPALSPLTWVQWRLDLPIQGAVTVQARAIDQSGHVQTATVHDQQPAGASGYHTVHVTV